MLIAAATVPRSLSIATVLDERDMVILQVITVTFPNGGMGFLSCSSMLWWMDSGDEMLNGSVMGEGLGKVVGMEIIIFYVGRKPDSDW